MESLKHLVISLIFGLLFLGCKNLKEEYYPDGKIKSKINLNKKGIYNGEAKFFNYKDIDKSSAIDIWYQIFYKTSKGTPAWWWKTKQPSKPKSEFNNNELKMIKQFYKFSDKDIEFLIKYYPEKLKDDIKRIKKFDGK